MTVTLTPFAERLDAELTRLAIAQFHSDEFRVLFDTPLTMDRARFVALQFVLYNINRRDCWGHIQAKAPWAVKRTIWKHEEDELYYDPRGGADHASLQMQECRALGVTDEELKEATAPPVVEAALRACCHVAMTLPWLGALVSSHFLERRNNSELIPGGGYAKRWRDKLVRELGLTDAQMVSTNVHVVADVDHSDAIWEAIAEAVTDEFTYQTALEGARQCAIVDRAYRGALGHQMRLMPGP